MSSALEERLTSSAPGARPLRRSAQRGRRFEALVDFGGALIPDALPPGVPYGEPDTEQSELLLASISSGARALPGTLDELRYQTARETPWVNHMGDADFLAAWLQHPRFRMVK
ncbi:DUF6368 family protein [Spirillospora albida]|uniref:DUF6368 family protein n=1 Tax=Spirillospora albida TaxID=58123 RepID=UPI003CCC398B